jgi:hypothetical protein
VTTDGGLAAEGAGVLGVLGDFHLLHLLTEGGTVTIGDSSVSGARTMMASPSATIVYAASDQAPRPVYSVGFGWMFWTQKS